jgi:uncharacterized delta-60 repeat protein
MAARLRSNGTLDPTFANGGIDMIPVGQTALGFGIAVQPSSGKLVLAGPAFTNTGVAATVRLDANGSLDRTFGTGGIGTIPTWYGVNGITIDASSRIVLPMTGPTAVRFNPNGTADQTFGTGGIAPTPITTGGAANGAAIQTDGKIVLAGATTINSKIVIAVTRLNGQSGTTIQGSGGTGSTTNPRLLRSLHVRLGKTVKATFALSQRVALVRVKLSALRGKSARTLIVTASRHNVRTGQHTVVLKLPSAYRKRGHRVRLLVELTVVAAQQTEHASRMT